MERLVGKEEAEAVAGHIAILLGFETKATTPDRDSLFQSVRVFVEAGARDEATAFVFEDIHWADPALLDLIELLAVRLHDLPVLLLTLARPELLDLRPGWGGGMLAYNALPLEPLDGTDAAELALHLLGADTKAAEVAKAGEGTRSSSSSSPQSFRRAARRRRASRRRSAASSPPASTPCRQRSGTSSSTPRSPAGSSGGVPSSASRETRTPSARPLPRSSDAT